MKQSNFKFAVAFRNSVLSNYNKESFVADILAGLAVGIIALPLSMALAIATGVPPQYGLYTAIIAGVIIAIFGGSRVNISGPTAAFVVVLQPIHQEFGMSGLAIATMLAGFLMIAMGYAKLGRIIQLIPYPVVIGFTAGIAFVIGSMQLNDLFGLQIKSSGGFFDKMAATLQGLPGLNLFDLGIGAATLMLLLTTQWINKKLPHYLIAVLFGIFSVYILNAFAPQNGIHSIGTQFSYKIGDLIGHGIPSVFPEINWPWNIGADSNRSGLEILGYLRDMIGPAFSIAMLGAIESLLCATIADGLSGTKHDPDAELVGQGIGNLLIPFAGGIPATAALARTAANVRSGARTPVASIVHSLVLIASIVFLAPLLSFIPMSTLAAILMLVAWNMSESRHFLRLLRVAPRSDVIVMLSCFGLTILTDMIIAITVGISLAGLLFIKRMAELSETSLVNASIDSNETWQKDNVAYFKIAGPLFFGAAHRTLSFIKENNQLDLIQVDFSLVQHIDFTAIVALESILIELAEKDIQVDLVNLNSQMTKRLSKAGLMNIGKVGYSKNPKIYNAEAVV